MFGVPNGVEPDSVRLKIGEDALRRELCDVGEDADAGGCSEAVEVRPDLDESGLQLEQQIYFLF